MLKKRLFVKRVKESLCDNEFPVSKLDLTLGFENGVITNEGIRVLRKTQLDRIDNFKRILSRLSQFIPTKVPVWNAGKEMWEDKDWFAVYSKLNKTLKMRIRAICESDDSNNVKINNLRCIIDEVHNPYGEYSPVVGGLLQEIGLFLKGEKVRIPVQNEDSNKIQKVSVRKNNLSSIEVRKERKRASHL